MTDDPVFGRVGGLEMLATIADDAELSFREEPSRSMVDVPFDRQDIKAVRWALRELEKIFRAPSR